MNLKYFTVKKNGVWLEATLTDEGRKVYRQFKYNKRFIDELGEIHVEHLTFEDVETFGRKVNMVYQKWATKNQNNQDTVELLNKISTKD